MYNAVHGLYTRLNQFDCLLVTMVLELQFFQLLKLLIIRSFWYCLFSRWLEFFNFLLFSHWFIDTKTLYHCIYYWIDFIRNSIFLRMWDMERCSDHYYLFLVWFLVLYTRFYCKLLFVFGRNTYFFSSSVSSASLFSSSYFVELDFLFFGFAWTFGFSLIFFSCNWSMILLMSRFSCSLVFSSI